MKNNKKRYRILSICSVSVSMLFLLGACEKDSGPGPDIHDTKYLVIDASGQAVEGLPGENDCVQDQFIGLVWEVKSDSPGLRDWRNTYSWYSPDESFEGELDYRGSSNAGQCAESNCDTTAYVEAVNRAGYCGHNDWRMPSRDELGSISDPRKPNNPPTINLKYFPHTQIGEYWSANDYQFQYNAAWRWSFEFGHDRVDWKKQPAWVRLVRGESIQLQRVKE
ncbi:MAG: DUF1566 domain-containing protein [Xanthomonadales bacterium]|nr:DUF1566 domain-containing protein [Xanthomonadales bacterium]